MHEKTRPMAVRVTEAKKAHTPKLLNALGVFIMVIVLLIGFAGLALLAYFNLEDRILPGVHVYNLPLGTKTYEEAEALIDQYWNEDAVVLFNLDETLFQVKAAELGFTVNEITTTEKAYLVGRDSGLLQELMALIKRNTIIIMPDLRYDETIARPVLESFALTVNTDAVDARIERSNNEYIAIPGVAGARLDVDGLLLKIAANPLMAVTGTTFDMHMLPIQPEVYDLSPLLDDIKQLMQSKYTLEAYDAILDEYTSFEVPTDALIDWIRVDQVTEQVWLEPNLESVQSILQEWDSSLQPERGLRLPLGPETIVDSWKNSTSALAEVIYSPTSYTIQPGDSLWRISLQLGVPMFMIMQANPEVSENTLYAGMQITIPSLNDLLPLPVVQNKRIVISISEQHMWIYENGELYKDYVISTGMEDSPTMAGIFQIQTHVLDAYASNWDLWMPHFMGIYEAWDGFMNGIHGLPLLSNGHRLWASNLGTPASYGCIILDLDEAEELYYWADEGVVVEIRR